MEELSPYKVSQYRRAANLVILFAEHGFFRSVSPETKETVGSVLEGMLWVDHYVDSLDAQNRKPIVKNILGYLGGKEPLAIKDEPGVVQSLTRLKDVMDRSTDAQRKEFLEKVVEVFDSGKKLSSTTSVREFIKEREKEAVASADMILVLAKELGANKQFSGFFRELSTAGNLLDSIDDAREDKASGKIAIKPIQLYFSLAQKTLTHAVKAVKVHPQKRQVIKVGLTWFLRHAGVVPKVPGESFEHILERTLHRTEQSRPSPQRLES